MLSSKNVTATVAVRDLKTARAFYEDKLELKASHEEGEEAVEYKCGDTSLLVYRSQYAGTNQATGATWNLGKDVETTVEALRAKGVEFEHYEMPDTKVVGDLHLAGNMKLAWFKDPDGNIHALMGE